MAPSPTRRAGDTTELAGRLRLANARLFRRLRQQSDTGLSPSQQSALASIEAQGPVTLGDLAVVEQVTPPTVTKVISRLDELGPDAVRRLGDAIDVLEDLAGATVVSGTP